MEEVEFLSPRTTITPLPWIDLGRDGLDWWNPQPQMSYGGIPIDDLLTRHGLTRADWAFPEGVDLQKAFPQLI